MPRSLKKGPFVDDHLLKKVDVLNCQRAKAGHQDLVPSLDDHPRHGRPHDRRPRRAPPRARLRDRVHGRPQARRVRPDPDLPLPRRPGARGSADDRSKTNERPGTRAVLRHCSMSASKARACSTSSGARTSSGPRDPRRRPSARPPRSSARSSPRPWPTRRTTTAGRRGALRLGLLRRRGCHHEALPAPRPGPGHADPQAHLPHHRSWSAVSPRTASSSRRRRMRGRSANRSRRVGRIAAPGRPARAGCRAAAPPQCRGGRRGR